MPSADLLAFARSSRRVLPAFTFIEILFAIIILGVGTIMIAGMLPVAIKQNADTRNDLTSKVVCDAGYAYLRTMIATHPEAFPETTGLTTVLSSPNAVTGAYSINQPGPIRPVNGSPFAAFMGATAMSLNPGDQYTVGGGFPFTPITVPAQPPTDRRAGRVVPLSFDVVYPTGFDIATLISNQAANDRSNPRGNAVDTDSYPLAWHQINLGDRIISSEPRFEWTAFYRRDEGASSIKLIIVALRQQNGEVVDRFRATDEPVLAGNATMPNEQINTRNGPFLVPMEIREQVGDPDRIVFTGTPGQNAYDIDVAEPGSYIIVAHSPPPRGGQPTLADDLNRPYRNNGRIFKLAGRRDDLDPPSGDRVWELAPGFDLGPAMAGNDGILGTADDLLDGSMDITGGYPIDGTRANDVAGTTAYAWIIGRGRQDPTSAAAGGTFVGPTQDLGILEVDVPLK